MENNETNENDKTEEGINISAVDVQIFDIDEGLNKIMENDYVQKAGALFIFLIAVFFGVMFIIGTISLVNGKKRGEVTAEVTAVETNEEAASETSGNDTETEAVEEE
ncbi:MAG: hypothetical protein ACUZ8H_10120 [Candidatus Anammoxibacter sp.]